ncbi:hypothetical protein [Cellvibrio sp.]|uniref:hypothetical protein n=1 Tax=Cellvibrio sp. TaxID=1965322 RepID=UPI0039648037
MKKLLVTSLIAASITYASFALAKNWDSSDSEKQSNWATGHHRFVAELNLDAERAAKMDAILGSYREIPKLYFTNQTEKIPAFLAQKEAELASLLTQEELTQFKQSFGEWAKKKNFKFMKFSYSQPQTPLQMHESQLPDLLYKEINQSIDGQIIELRNKLNEKFSNA